MKKTSIYKFIVLTLSIFMLSACGKNTQEDLKSHDWILEMKDTHERPNVHFTNDKMTLSEFGINVVTSYELDKDKITVVKNEDNEDEKEILKYYIKKENDSYKLTALNKKAKDGGDMTLIPK
ncbi:TPA: hypothetical protein U3L45_002192 [Streptococcus agalactiae]|nr:hypothetical protein [Streptococcus agalactiae]HEM9599380.1 hypothetical protein [Streptococcus agalactiae]HEM9636275.1 hypothetical protein [Streptococcus agalactiae]